MAVDAVTLRKHLFVGFLLLVTILFLYVIRPFAYPLFWAAILAILFNPIYAKLNERLKAPNFSATATLGLVIIIIVVPLMFITTLIVKESVTAYDALKSGGRLTAIANQINNSLRNRSFLEPLHLNQDFITQKFNDAGRAAVDIIINAATSLTQNSIVFVLLAIMMLYALFFFLRDGEKIARRIVYLLPLGGRYEQALYKKLTSAINASLKGTVVIGVLQGITGAVLFLATGVPGAMILAIIMGIFAIIPSTGTFIIWLPVGVGMILTGKVWQGVVIIAIGLLIITIIDNFLRPWVVGKDMQVNPLLILFTTLGGLFIFGLSGFVIGPVIAALFVALWEIYEQYYHAELSDG